ncbi:MAG: epimerase [Lentisphaeria bacterium]|nr:epimerase [Lentisphaeria bacterium]
MERKKVLVLGATGAMGQYLVPGLAEMGYTIDAVSLDEAKSDFPNVNCIRGNAKEREFLWRLLENNYDGIVDFMIYTTAELPCLPPLTEKTGHYIYLSSYRVYDDREHPVRESSPRLLDSSGDVLLRNSDDYSIYKARGENIIRALPRKNWTIIRPAITYSLMRYQLVTLEAANTVGRAFAGKPVVLPEQARNIQATMSWAGDVSRMIAGLLFNEKAVGEAFTVATAEHHTWGEIADYYKDICRLEAHWVDQEDYLRILAHGPWQLKYDRLFNRIMDNSKVLAATGMKQSELTPLYDGLSREIARCPRNIEWPVCEAMDEYLKQRHC